MGTLKVQLKHLENASLAANANARGSATARSVNAYRLAKSKLTIIKCSNAECHASL